MTETHSGAKTKTFLNFMSGTKSKKRAIVSVSEKI